VSVGTFRKVEGGVDWCVEHQSVRSATSWVCEKNLAAPIDAACPTVPLYVLDGPGPDVDRVDLLERKQAELSARLDRHIDRSIFVEQRVTTLEQSVGYLAGAS
jgi:hypothetical protein